MDTKKHELVFAADRMLEEIDRVTSTIAERVERVLSSACTILSHCDDYPDYDQDGNLISGCECQEVACPRSDLVTSFGEETLDEVVSIRILTAYEGQLQRYEVGNLLDQLGDDYPRDLLPVYVEDDYDDPCQLLFVDNDENVITWQQARREASERHRIEFFVASNPEETLNSLFGPVNISELVVDTVVDTWFDANDLRNQGESNE